MFRYFPYSSNAFIVPYIKKGSISFSVLNDRCRSCTDINLSKGGRAVIQDRIFLLLWLVRWLGVKHRKPTVDYKEPFPGGLYRRLILPKRPRKTTVFIQELVQSLQRAFDSSRCVHVVSADCRKEKDDME